MLGLIQSLSQLLVIGVESLDLILGILVGAFYNLVLLEQFLFGDGTICDFLNINKMAYLLQFADFVLIVDHALGQIEIQHWC